MWFESYLFSRIQTIENLSSPLLTRWNLDLWRLVLELLPRVGWPQGGEKSKVPVLLCASAGNDWM